MVTRSQNLSSLYEVDETAYLEATVALIAHRRLDELDFPNIGEYLSDMAKRNRREVTSRLRILMAHLLKWLHQPDQRSNGWQRTILSQRNDLEILVAAGVLRNHAEAVLGDVYGKAVKQAAEETGLDEAAFPASCPWDVEQLLSASALENA